MRSAFVLALAGVLSAGPAAGQWIEAVELGFVGRYGFYDADVGLQNTPGAGGRLGVWFGPSLGLEGDWVFLSPRPAEHIVPDVGSRVAHDLFGVRLVHARPVGERADLLVGLGLAYDRYFREREVGVSGGGISGLLGVRLGIREALSLRLEGTAYHVRRDAHAPLPRPTTTNFGLQATFAYMFRGRPEERIIELPPPPPDTVFIERRRPPG